MNEYFLHYIWRYRLFKTTDLKTSTGDSIQVLFPGLYNQSEGGPDFLNARLRIGNTLWVGHVEIHIKGSDWDKHNHTHDPHYRNVILHVVYKNDVEIHLHNPGDLAVLELKEVMREDQLDKYKHWVESSSEIPCDLQKDRIESVQWVSWKERMLIERLEEKSRVMLELLNEVKGHWPEAFYRRIAWNFGFSANAVGFELLARSIPMKILTRYREDKFVIEALLFGQSGLLSAKFQEDYPIRMLIEYTHLANKHRLHSLSPAAWTFGGVRPSNFPTIRLSQFASLISNSENLLAVILEEEDVSKIRSFFRVAVSEYWQNHYVFDKVSNVNRKQCLGEHAIDNIVINSVAVTLFAFGKFHNEEKYSDKAFRIFELCKPESNHITKNWERRGVDNEHAGDSQALIQMYSRYCNKRRCLECGIGHALLKVNNYDKSYS